MGVTRTSRLLTGAFAGAIVLGAMGTTAAEARPTKPGGVTINSATATEPAIGTYDVSASWAAASNATSYRASISRAGVVLASASVASTSWSTNVAATPGQQLTVTVQGVRGHFKGKAGVRTFTLTDQIAPTATYTSKWDNNTGDATLTESGLTDDSPLSGVTRTVDWGDGSILTYAAGDPIQHTYALDAQRYVPVVTLSDAAHNTSAPVDAPAVVIDDTQAPTGSYSVDTASAWAKLTKVTLTQTAVPADNWSPAAKITRSVDWGDGTAAVSWTSGTTLTHTYSGAGVFTPSVTLTDEAGNQAVVASTPVTVKVDSTAPVVKLTLPKHKHSVRAFRTLRGKATDSHGTGVKKVTLKAVEKRGKAWYGYNAKTKKWVKAASKAKAFSRARAFTLKTTATHTWAAKLARLTKGTLVYRVRATDLVNNASATLSHTARLTHR